MAKDIDFNTMLPELMVTDIQKSLGFYTTLGFTVEYTRPDPPFAFLAFGKTNLMLQELRIHEKEQSKLERPFGRGILFQIESDNVHTMVGRLQEKGYVIKRAIRKSWFRNDDIEYGGLEFLVSDPDGYVLQFLEGIGERKA